MDNSHLSLFVLLGALFQDQMLSLRIIGVLAGIAYQVCRFP